MWDCQGAVYVVAKIPLKKRFLKRGQSWHTHRFEVDPEESSSASASSGTNSNSSMSTDVTLNPPPPSSGQKKRPKLKSADPLSFEELGKVYTNISRREIVAKVRFRKKKSAFDLFGGCNMFDDKKSCTYYFLLLKCNYLLPRRHCSYSSINSCWEV